MVIAFLGHSDFIGWAEYESTMMHLLKAIIGEEAVDFYLGGYGNFDSFAYECCRKYKLNNKRCNLVFISQCQSKLNSPKASKIRAIS